MGMKDEIVLIDIGKQYSKYPAGRTPADGAYNGETFREKFLKVPLRAGNTILVKLDGAISYGSSFLEEAFGGLVREHNFNANALRNRVKLETDDPFLEDEIWSYIDRASETKR